MLDKLRFETTHGVSIELPLSWGITWILGDGNTGKTYLFTELQKFASVRNLNMLFINQNNMQNIQLIPNLSSDVFIVVDNYDLVHMEHPEIEAYLNTTEHQALVIGRDTVGLRVDFKYIFKLELRGKALIAEPYCKVE